MLGIRSKGPEVGQVRKEQGGTGVGMLGIKNKRDGVGQVR